MTNLIITLILSVLFTWILTGPVGWKHPRGATPVQGKLFIFLIFSVTMLAISKWISDGDPVHSNLHWIASMFTGVILFLLFIALSVPAQLLDKRHENQDTEPAHDKAQAKTVFSISFWLLLVVLLVLTFI